MALPAICAPLAACGQSASSSSRATDADASVTSGAVVSSPAVAFGATSKLVARDGAWHATSRRNGYSTTVDGRGATLAGLRGSNWTLGLHATRVGRDGAMTEVATSAPTELDDRVVIAHGAGLSEWFVHDARGLEHGVDLANRPSGAGDLVVDVAVDGLTPTVVADGTRATLTDAKGHLVLSYGHLVVRDADGHAVAATMRVEGTEIALHVSDVGAQYPIEIDPLVTGLDQAELTSADFVFSDFAGSSVAFDGTSAILGAPGTYVGGNQSVGAAYVFTQTGSSWSQQAQLLASDGSPFASFGQSVAVSGTTAILGAPNSTASGYGIAYVFTRSGTTWTQQQELTAPDYAANGGFGGRIAMSETTAIITATTNTAGAPAAYIFAKTGTSWTLQKEFYSPSGSNTYGSSVAISDTMAVVGDSTVMVGSTAFAGAAYVYALSGGTWSYQTELTGASGTANFSFGASVAISGTTVIVGAPALPETPANEGAAFIFTQSGSTWTSQQLTNPDGVARDEFGSGVAINGATAIVGASQVTVGANLTQGAAYVFTLDGTTWTQGLELLASDGATNDHFGGSLAMSGTTAIIGAPTKNSTAGAAYVFTVDATGASCATPSACASGFCVDGVCCNTACTATCMACATAYTGQPNGTCFDTLNGLAPHADCPGSSCASGTLSNNVCNGSGLCRANTAQCAPYICGGTVACSTTCNPAHGNADCASGAYCSGTSCVDQAASGSACSAADQCISGVCSADGVCCATACSGTCMACSVTHTGVTSGTCAPVVTGTDPLHQCPGESCSGASQQNGHVCNGSGACQATTTTACAPYACNAAGTACATSCTVGTDAGCNTATDW
ncbi:MAG: FG-GAP repeat protein, partial [Polyangiales bacterium]